MSVLRDAEIILFIVEQLLKQDFFIPETTKIEKFGFEPLLFVVDYRAEISNARIFLNLSGPAYSLDG
jgi:hypothetical protein